MVLRLCCHAQSSLTLRLHLLLQYFYELWRFKVLLSGLAPQCSRIWTEAEVLHLGEPPLNLEVHIVTGALTVLPCSGLAAEAQASWAQAELFRLPCPCAMPVVFFDKWILSRPHSLPAPCLLPACSLPEQ